MSQVAQTGHTFYRCLSTFGVMKIQRRLTFLKRQLVLFGWSKAMAYLSPQAHAKVSVIGNILLGKKFDYVVVWL